MHCPHPTPHWALYSALRAKILSGFLPIPILLLSDLQDEVCHVPNGAVCCLGMHLFVGCRVQVW